MADSRKLVPLLLRFEGGYVNDPDDAGGATNKGVTLKTFRQFFGQDKTVDDLKAITDEQWHTVFKKGYWDAMWADKIDSQSVANILVDWAYNSGRVTATKHVQKILGVTYDGIMGSQTINAINQADALCLFNQIKKARIRFYENIVISKPSQKKFLRGWLNRVGSFTFND